MGVSVRSLRPTLDHFMMVTVLYNVLFSVQTAKNIYTREDLMAEFFSSPPEPDRTFNLSKKRNVLIFHCEFSSERAPNLWVEEVC